MAKYTKKWEKDFIKKYSQTIKQLQSLEKEYKEMVDANPDEYINPIFGYGDNDIDFGVAYDWDVNHYMRNASENTPEEVSFTFRSEGQASFTFALTDYKSILSLRDKLIKACDEFERPQEIEKVDFTDPRDCSDEMTDEEWENMELKEFTVQVWRPCTQTWTMTIQARNSCEAELKAQTGEPEEDVRHDENDELTDYGEETYECI